MSTRIAVISEGLAADLRPLCYSRSTWDIPFLGKPLLHVVFEWLKENRFSDVFLVDDTPGLWLHALAAKAKIVPKAVHAVDARTAASVLRPGEETCLELPRGGPAVLLLKPCALMEPDLDTLQSFHDEADASATFALVRLDPGSLQWPSIPSCRMDVTGRILQVDKLKRTDALGSTRLDNVLGSTAPSRPREYWAPRNVALMEKSLVSELPLGELAAPLAGLARSLAERGVPCYGRSMPGRWWSMSTPSQVLNANFEAAAPARPVDSSDTTIREMVSRMKARVPTAGHAPRMKGLVAAAAASVERQAKYPGVHAKAIIDDGVVLGEGVKVAKGARVLGGSVVGPACMLGENVSVVRSVLGERCMLDPRCSVESSLLATGTVLPAEISLKHAVMAMGEVQNLVRGVPASGTFLDAAPPIQEAEISAYWTQSAPVADRTPGKASVKVLGQSMENDVYHISDGGTSFVLKRRLDRNARPLVREFHVMRMLKSGVAPRGLALDLRPELGVAPCLVMEFADGKRVPEGGIDVDTAARIGRSCARIHATPTGPLLRDLPELSGWGYADLLTYVREVLGEYRDFLEWRSHDGLAEDELTRYVLSLLEWMTGMAETENVHWLKAVPQALCHGDLREFNMLVPAEGDGILLLDWERCGVGDPAYDLGWFLALSELSPQAETALEEAYGQGPEGDASFWSRARTYRVIDLIAWPVHLMGMVQRCRRQATRMTAKAPKLARAYEDDAYRSLAIALNSFSRLSGNGQASAYTPESIRQMGTLFAPL